MLEKSFGVFYYLKQAKNQKDEKRYVYLRITVDGIHRELSIKRQWALSQWNTSFGRAIGDNKETKELNSYLNLILSKVYQAKTKLHERNKPVTAVGIKEVLLGKDEKKYFIKAIFLEHNIQMKALVGKNVAEGTLTRYKTTYSHISNFIRWRYEKEDMELGAINHIVSRPNYDKQEMTLVPKEEFLARLEAEGKEIVWFVDHYSTKDALNDAIKSDEHPMKTRKYMVWYENGELKWGKFWDARFSNHRDEEPGNPEEDDDDDYESFILPKGYIADFRPETEED